MDVNNKYCTTKFRLIGDVFTGYPASSDYPETIEGVVEVANIVINLGYSTIGSCEEFKKKVLETLLSKREELKELMKKI